MDVESLKAWHNRERVAWLTTRSSNDPEHCETMAEFHASAIALLSAARDEGRAEGLGGEWVMVPREPTYELLRAMSESVAVDDEGPFPPLFDLLDFSGENKTYTVLRAAYAAMIAAAPPASQIKEG